MVEEIHALNQGVTTKKTSTFQVHGENIQCTCAHIYANKHALTLNYPHCEGTTHMKSHWNTKSTTNVNKYYYSQRKL